MKNWVIKKTHFDGLVVSSSHANGEDIEGYGWWDRIPTGPMYIGWLLFRGKKKSKKNQDKNVEELFLKQLVFPISNNDTAY
jgi:hypothetical protein